MDFFKTRRRLILERDHAWHELDKLRYLLQTTDDINLLRAAIIDGKDNDPPRVLPGSDIGRGELVIQHWAVGAFAASFIDMIDEIGAENYLIVPFTTVDGRAIELTIRRCGMMSPHEKANALEEKCKALEAELEKHRTTTL